MVTHSMEKILRDTRTYFKKRGMRFTPQREKIIREIFREDFHFDISQLTFRLRGQNIAVSRATLYRTLNTLVELKYLKAIIHQEGQRFYEHILDHEHHDHLICTTCGTIVEFHEAELETLQEKIAHGHGFTMTDHIHDIYGLCRNCQSHPE